MQLVLKHDILYLENIKIPTKSRLIINLNVPYAPEEYRFYIKINNKPFKEIEEVFEISKEDLRKAKLNLELKVKARKRKEEFIYKTDPISIKNYLLIGEDTTDTHPHSIATLQAQVEQINKSLKTLKKAVVELGKKGELL